MNEIEIKFENNREKQFKDETFSDTNLEQVLKFLDMGWPNKIKECGELKHYFKIRNNLTKENGLIYFDNKLVVPKSMKKYVLEKLHNSFKN